MVNQKEISELLDKLTLDALDLIEQDVRGKITIEQSTNEGQLLVAKARYIQGHNSVGESQLPTENSPEFKAISSVNHNLDELNVPKFEVNTHKVDKDGGYVDPVKWFGVLVPQSLHAATEKFRKAVEFTVEAANIQTRLLYTLYDIKALREMKIKNEE